MKKKYRLSNNEDIDLKEIINLLWKEKLFIFFFSLFFLVMGSIYGFFQPKLYQVDILTRKIPESLLQFNQLPNNRYKFSDSIATSISKTDLHEILDYDSEFLLSVLSNNNLAEFIQQYKKINQSTYKEIKDTDIQKILTLDIDRKRKINNASSATIKFTLTYQKPFQGSELLNDYIHFSKLRSDQIFKKHLKILVSNQIKKTENDIEIAKATNVEYPSQFSNHNLTLETGNYNFFNGSVALSIMLNHLKEILANIDDIIFDFNPVVKTLSSTLVSKSITYFAFIYFFLGLLLSLIIIFVKNSFSK